MSGKKRHWSFILYPESAPPDWYDTLASCCIPCAISPLHDMDVDKEGNLKKPHYHILLSYPGPTTFNNVNVLTRSLFQPIPIPIVSLRSAYEYLYHKNDPDKYQYDKSAIRCLSGFTLPSFDKGDCVMDVVKRTIQFIEDNNITEFNDLVSAVCSLSDDDMLSCLMTKSYFFVQYIRSRMFSSMSSELSLQNRVMNSDFPVHRLEDYDGR